MFHGIIHTVVGTAYETAMQLYARMYVDILLKRSTVLKVFQYILLGSFVVGGKRYLGG